MTPKGEHGPSDLVKNSQESRIGRRGSLGLFAAGAAVSALAACAPTEATPEPRETPPATEPNNHETPEPSAPNSQESTDPVETETPKSYEEQISELEIEAGLSAEEFGNRYMTTLYNQRFSIATEELWEKTFNDYSISTPDIEEIIYQESTEALETMYDAIFMKDWQDYPSLAKARNNQVNANIPRIYQWGFNHNREFPDYKEWFIVDSVEEKKAKVDSNGTTTARIMTIIGTQFNNYNEIEQDVTNAEAVNGAPFDIVIGTIVDNNGKEKIIDFDVEYIITS